MTSACSCCCSESDCLCFISVALDEVDDDGDDDDAVAVRGAAGGREEGTRPVLTSPLAYTKVTRKAGAR